jgi:hypothetical protein
MEVPSRPADDDLRITHSNGGGPTALTRWKRFRLQPKTGQGLLVRQKSQVLDH